MRKVIFALLLIAVLPMSMVVTAQQTGSTTKEVQAKQLAPNLAEFDKRMAQMQENMKKMQEEMSKIQQTQDPQERQRLLQEHWTTMQGSMELMYGMWGPGMMGGRMGGPMMGGPMMMGGHSMGPMMGGPMMGWSATSEYYSKLTPEQLKQRQYMTDRYLAMQQLMMSHMMWHQYWMVPQQPPASAN